MGLVTSSMLRLIGRNSRNVICDGFTGSEIILFCFVLFFVVFVLFLYLFSFCFVLFEMLVHALTLL